MDSIIEFVCRLWSRTPTAVPQLEYHSPTMDAYDASTEMPSPLKRKEPDDTESYVTEGVREKRQRPTAAAAAEFVQYVPLPTWAADVQIVCVDDTGGVEHPLPPLATYFAHRDVISVAIRLDARIDETIQPASTLVHMTPSELPAFDDFLRFLYEKDLSGVSLAEVWGVAMSILHFARRLDCPVAKDYLFRYFKAHFARHTQDIVPITPTCANNIAPILWFLVKRSESKGVEFRDATELLLQAVVELDPKTNTQGIHLDVLYALRAAATLYKALLAKQLSY